MNTTIIIASALSVALGGRILPSGAERSATTYIYQELDELDSRADQKWQSIGTRGEYDAWRKELHAKMIEAIGGLPERTPLNAKVVAICQRAGYRVEKVIFESMPGVFVTANCFVPDAATVNSKVPAVVMSCGHSDNGKDADVYLRACVLVAQRGMVALMFDPYEQGERITFTKFSCTSAHNLIGVKATLLGSSMAQLRIWDGMRAVDYVMERPEVDCDKIGYMGQSGGGTMTALMTAIDWRLKATAPSCYLTSLRYLCRLDGPQDAEQNIFGQLAFGLNHTGYALLPDTKVCITGRYDDFFPWGGVADLYRTVKLVAERLGEVDHYALNFSAGSHGWTESTETASADWMAAWLGGRKELLPLDLAAYRMLDLGFDLKKADTALVDGERGVTDGRDVLKLPGARDIHTVLRERFKAYRDRWPKQRSADEKCALARKYAKLRMPAEIGLRNKEISTSVIDGVTCRQFVFMYPNGFAIPAVLMEPSPRNLALLPVLMVGAKGRGEFAEESARIAKAGAPVLVADLTGYGETSDAMHVFYGAKETPEEGAAVMLYLMGDSMIGRRATDMVALGSWLKSRYGMSVSVLAKDTAVIPAAHAYAGMRGVFNSIRTDNEPLSWSELLLNAAPRNAYRFAHVIHGALTEYDWPQLLDDLPGQ